MKASELIAKFQYALDNNWGYIYGKTHELWTLKKQEQYAKAYDGVPERQMSVDYGAKWVDHWVTNCSGLFAWAFSQFGQSIYHGSNTMYNKYCVARGALSKGKRSDGQDLKPGTAVFTGDSGHKGHVGLYIGDGWVIEAAGTQQGVIKSKVTAQKWNWWGELSGVQYSVEGGDAPMPSEETRPTLRKGSRGEYVKQLQQILMSKGYSVGSYGADGIFGTATDIAVRRAQEDAGLVIDGIVGPKTWAALDASPAAAMTYTVTVYGATKEQASALLKEYPTANVVQERG